MNINPIKSTALFSLLRKEVQSHVLCGSPTGRITCLAHKSLSLCACPIWAHNLKNKHRKTKIGIDDPRGTSKWSANFQLKGQSSKSQDIKTT